jgi:hypothetical protein
MRSKKDSREVQQLRMALKASQEYADKLVAGIPYLPADIKNLREANLEFSNEIQMYEDLLKDMKHIVSKQEFPGPFSIERNPLNQFVIKDNRDDIIFKSNKETFAYSLLSFLNKLSERYSQDC